MIDPLTARVERRGPVAPRAALAKLAAALLIAVPLILSIDVVSASVALLLEIPLLLLAGLGPREFWVRTAVLWIAAPLSAVTIALYGAQSGTVHFEWLFMRVSDGSLTLAAATAVRVLASLDRVAGGLEYAEQPVPGVEDLAALRRRGVTEKDQPRMLVWLSAGRTLAPQRRSVIFEVVTRVLFHAMIVFALFLLFSGHNAPGGGFAAGPHFVAHAVRRYRAVGSRRTKRRGKRGALFRKADAGANGLRDACNLLRP